MIPKYLAYYIGNGVNWNLFCVFVPDAPTEIKESVRAKLISDEWYVIVTYYEHLSDIPKELKLDTKET